MQVKLSNAYRDKADNVSYTAIGEDGKRRDFKNRACYFSVTQNPGGYEVTCRPWDGKNSSPPLRFQRFFRELQKCGLVPKAVRAGALNGKNIVVIPREGWGYHPVFITLSMYRHADCHGRSILGRTMKLYDQLHLEGVHFLQCLHWSLVHSDHGTWHSCFNLRAGPPSPYDGAHEHRNNDLRYGFGIAAYGKLSLEEQSAIPGASSTSMFDTFAKELGSVKIESLDEILDPKHAKYYEDPEEARR